jgi:hypothetical protein
MAGAETFTVGIEGNHNSTASDPPRPEHWFGATAEADLRNLPRGNVTVAGLPFDLPRGERDCLAPPLGESVVVKVNRTAASLRFLHTACVPAAAAAALAKEFEKAANWAGIPIGRYTIVFSDGTTDACPVLYNMNVGPWHRSDGRLPYVYRAVGFLRTASNALRRTDGDALDICLYVAQWVNPQPAKTIVRVELTGSDLATPVLFAVTGRGLRQDLGPAP